MGASGARQGGSAEAADANARTTKGADADRPGAGDRDNAAGQAPAPPRRRPGRPRHVVPSAEFLEKQGEIVKAAAAVFREQGYDRGSLDDVAAVLNVRKASVYHYVKSKQQLLYMVFEAALNSGSERLRELAEISDPGERLSKIIRFQVEIVAEDLDHFAVFFDHFHTRRSIEHHAGRVGAELTERVSRLERSYFRIFVTAVKDASAAGVIPDVDPRYAAHAILGMTSWLYKWYDPRRDDVDSAAQTCVRLIVRQAPGQPD